MVGRQATYFNLGENVTTVFDTSIAVIGISSAKSPDHSEAVHFDTDKRIYRKIICNEENEVIGMVVLNDFVDVGMVSTAIQNREVIDPDYAEKIVKGHYPFQVR